MILLRATSEEFGTSARAGCRDSRPSTKAIAETAFDTSVAKTWGIAEFCGTIHGRLPVPLTTWLRTSAPPRYVYKHGL